jgi:nitrogen regulatory protein PII
MNEDGISMLMVIAPYKLKEDLVEKLHDNGALFINVTYGRGSLSGSTASKIFNFMSEDKKVVITSFAKMKEADTIVDLLEEKMDFKKPNTGFAFIVPVDEVSN